MPARDAATPAVAVNNSTSEGVKQLLHPFNVFMPFEVEAKHEAQLSVSLKEKPSPVW